MTPTEYYTLQKKITVFLTKTGLFTEIQNRATKILYAHQCTSTN